MIHSGLMRFTVSARRQHKKREKINWSLGHKRQISIMSQNLSDTDPSSFANENINQ